MISQLYLAAIVVFIVVVMVVVEVEVVARIWIFPSLFGHIEAKS